MHLTDEYVRVQEDVIRRCTEYASHGNDPDRYGILKRFCLPYKKILSVGSAGYEPILTGSTHATDVSPVALILLKESGWKGKFKVGSCTDLPYRSKSFDCGVCTEVIEHLPSMDDVDKTFFEIDRVCKNWILTTPCKPVPEPDHKRLFTPEQMRAYAAMYSAQAVKLKIWWFVWRGHPGFSIHSELAPQRGHAMYSYNIPRGMSHA